MYGRSISVRAPKLFLSILTRKAESAGGKVEEFSTYHTALSQVCVCGQKHKKRLSERVHACDCGVVMQRDLFSAYLAKHVKEERLQAANAFEHWQGAEPLLRTAWQQALNQPASGRPVPSSFGSFRSQSGSSEKESLPYDYVIAHFIDCNNISPNLPDVSKPPTGANIHASTSFSLPT